MPTVSKEKHEVINEFLNEVESKDDLIEVLHKIQDLFGYIPKSMVTEVANTLDIPVATIYGVISFYSRFSIIPKGKYAISVCMGTACYVKGAQSILDEISEELGIGEGETTLDMKFSITKNRCIGACGLAPVILINEDVHGKLRPEDIKGILEQYK